MRINRQQQRAFVSLFTARSWTTRLSAIVVLAIAAFTWWSQSQVSPGQLIKGSQISGQVVAVADGDTVTVLDANNKQFKLRLAYIDAPEKAMPYGQAAKQKLSDLVYRQEVIAEIDDVDRYGRGVARLKKGEQDINLAQVNAGLAWHYATYAKKTQSRSEFNQYEQAQSAATAQQLGLWQDHNPTPPWDWRKSQRKQ
jgi:endonuclease YncB( thermonuclease family)